MSGILTRRTLVKGGLTAVAGVTGVGAAIHAAGRYGLIPPDYGGVVGIGETLTYSAQRLLTSGYSMAREFSRGDISKIPIVNGPAPADAAFRASAINGFPDWRLQVEGLVARPASFSLAEMQNLPAESHIALHACEQGWSYIAEWTGVRLSALLDLVKTRAQARYVVFMPFANPRQTTGEVRVQWDSIDMADALHPQTLLAYGMNGEKLPADFGAPLRLRMGRQLGYKNIKYLSKLIVTDDMGLYRKGAGTWYGGI
jgi:DMSO/TMAO reductase YedYZ molybdopterin-dependent catalytic subunit